MAPDSEPTPRVPWLPVNEGTPPAAPPTTEPLTPTKPVVPAWIQRDAVPQPVEVEDAEVIAPVEPPRAEELLPSAADAPPEYADEPPITPQRRSDDPVQLLGETAVASAALSAAGAPTPLGGVPLAPVDHAVAAPDFGDAVPAFIPAFDDEPQPTHREKADALAAGIVAEEQAMLASSAQDFDGGVAYAPLAFGEGTAAAITKRGGDDLEAATVGEAPGADGVPPSRTKKRRWWLWILLAVVVLGAVAAAIAVVNKPEATVIPGVTVTEPPPSPTIIPSDAPTATAFQASMPTSVGTFALVSAVALDPADVALTAGRIADGVDLSYRSGADTMTVRALQYYNEDDATAMFTQFAGEDAVTQPVEAGGVTVGESAEVTDPAPGMVWRNGTSVFILTGPAAQIAGFYAQFGL